MATQNCNAKANEINFGKVKEIEREGVSDLYRQNSIVIVRQKYLRQLY